MDCRQRFAGQPLPLDSSRRPLEQPDLPDTLPRFVGRDYSRKAVLVGVLGVQGMVLANDAYAAGLLDETARRFGVVRGASLDEAAGAASVNEVPSAS